MAPQEPSHWLDKYANNHHSWHQDTKNGRKVYKRRLGLVETSFDIDGEDYGGRADLHALLTLEVCSRLSRDEFRERIRLAWASLHLQHVLLGAKVERDGDREFVVNIAEDSQEVVEEASRSLVFVEDHYEKVDSDDLFFHVLNVGRLLDPSVASSILYVLPTETLPNGNIQLRLLFVAAHHITDGLSMYHWQTHLIRILNVPLPDLHRDIDFFRSEEQISSRLPPAQEDLYPPISGSKARQRWFWAIIRVLRHVQRTLPPTFVNPLRREQRLETVSFPPTYSKIFNYSPECRPPMNSYQVLASLSPTASQRLMALSRSCNASVGAGCFALVGLAQMEMEEAKNPHIPLSERRPFAASFPLNPRLFFGYNKPSDSCMLAFSDGIVLPFLSSDLPIEKRFKLAVRQANRQLRVYQKRLKTGEVNISLDAHSPGRLLASAYLFQIERVEAKLLSEGKTGMNPQGEYPAKTSEFGATNGVSSIGSLSAFFRPGMVGLEAAGEEKDFAADFRAVRMGLRTRDNEFLVGSSTDHKGCVNFGAGYDGNAIDEEAAQLWKRKMEGLLEVEEKEKARL